MSEPQQPPAQPYGSPPPQHAAPPHDAAPPQHPAGQPYPATQPYASSPQYPSPSQYPGPSQYPSQSQYPSPSQYPNASPAAPVTGPGRLAFILAVVSLGLGLVTTVSYPLIFRWSYDPVVIGAFGTVGNGLVFLVALAGLLLGIVAARKQGSKILPGIAIGITAAQLAGILISWVSNLFYALPF